ncbi:MAG: hypothetical protein GXY53_04190 [Desulfobulbus sp.]|nr:hypothetical protein [Desulfobulbus sp.]
MISILRIADTMSTQHTGQHPMFPRVYAGVLQLFPAPCRPTLMAVEGENTGCHLLACDVCRPDRALFMSVGRLLSAAEGLCTITRY